MRITFGIGDYLITAHDGDGDDRSPAEVLLHEHFDLPQTARDEGSWVIVTVDRGGAPILRSGQRYSPSDSGFWPGTFFVPETDILFIGAGERVLVYDLARPTRLQESTADCGFWEWSRHKDIVLMHAELELAAWSLQGRKLWSIFVDPPWAVKPEREHLHLTECGGSSRVIDLRTGANL